MRILAGALFAALLVQAGCGGPDEPAPRPVPKKQPPPTPPPPPSAPAPVAARPAPPPQPAPLAAVPIAVPDASRTVPRGPEKGPQPGTAFDPAISTPSFTFRTMDHQDATVFINGHRHSATSALWSVTLNTAFDPKIPIPDGPPSGAKPCGKASREDSEIELWIEGGHYEQEAFAPVRTRYPHLVDGEQILYVKARCGGAERTGALRVRVVGKDGALYRWTDYTPIQSADDETAMRFSRTLWFYAVRRE